MTSGAGISYQISQVTEDRGILPQRNNLVLFKPLLTISRILSDSLIFIHLMIHLMKKRLVPDLRSVSLRPIKTTNILQPLQDNGHKSPQHWLRYRAAFF
jgi:hypothetical protein